MKKPSAIFLQFVVFLIGVVALALLLLEPRLEGVNANAKSLYDIYFDDPFLMLVYAGSLPFFFALYQAIRILSAIGNDSVFSLEVVKALRTIKYCALAVVGFVAVEEAFILLTHGSDDAAGGIMIGIMIAFGSIVFATLAATFEKTVQSAVDMKSENDLTV